MIRRVNTSIRSSHLCFGSLSGASAELDSGAGAIIVGLFDALQREARRSGIYALSDRRKKIESVKLRERLSERNMPTWLRRCAVKGKQGRIYVGVSFFWMVL